jgi:cellobiose PTS system EIIB component
MPDQPKKMIKAMMVCAMGMSSSLLEIKTREAAAKVGQPFEIKAVAVNEITRWDPGAHPVDIVLVAPQVFYKRKALELVGERHGIIVQGIDPMVFGMVDGDKLFDQIIKAVTARDEAKSGAKPAAAADKPKEASKESAAAEAKAKAPAKDTAKTDTKAKEPEKDKPAKK